MTPNDQLPTSEGVEYKPYLSICIATFKRAAFIGATLESILGSIPPDVEVLVVDGASPDNTEAVVSSICKRYPLLRYIRETTNSGVDRDYDKAVRYASGEYCWLMTDDDLLKPGAIEHVLRALSSQADLIVVNSEVWDADLGVILDSNLLKFDSDRDYAPASADNFLSEVGNYLSFVGGAVVRRSSWLARCDGTYFGTLFGHVGVIFDGACMLPAKVIAMPLIQIRYGNAMWTARGFEIWMFKWPDLIWSFPRLSSWAKLQVTRQYPWRSIRKLVLYRGTGGYSSDEYERFLRNRAPMWWRPVCAAVGAMPAALANFIAAVYCTCVNRKARALMYDLARSRHSTVASRFLARRLLT